MGILDNDVRPVLSSKTYIFVAVVFAILGILIWLILLRPVVEQSAYGTISAKGFRQASTYRQHQPGASRGLQSTIEIPIAESNVLQLSIEGIDESVPFSINTVSGRSFTVGQRVIVTFTERSIGAFWRRIYVSDVKPANKLPK